MYKRMYRHTYMICLRIQAWCTVHCQISLSLNQSLLNKIDTSTMSGLHGFLRNANNTIILTYEWLYACWETSTKDISDRWHEGHPKRKSMRSNDGYAKIWIWKYGASCLNPIMTWISWFWFIKKRKLASESPKRVMYAWFCGSLRA